MSSLRRLIPLADRVLVSRASAVTQTAGGIYLPESSTTKSNEGTVVAVGPGRTTADGSVLPMSVAVGDSVLLPEYGGQKVEVDEKEFTLIRDEDILAKFGSD
eukprot:PLAT8852.1.p2 GENE.PLAT8852.1~~PLAT8852.1.p2  ORF type:complete len:102 (+),score=28.59 PLAT8852.1:111-416(+)